MHLQLFEQELSWRVWHARFLVTVFFKAIQNVDGLFQLLSSTIPPVDGEMARGREVIVFLASYLFLAFSSPAVKTAQIVLQNSDAINNLRNSAKLVS